jgi:hypothetical protein
MKEFVASNLVDKPEAVAVEMEEQEDKTIFKLRVEQCDVGKLIGKNGFGIQNPPESRLGESRQESSARHHRLICPQRERVHPLPPGWSQLDGLPRALGSRGS